MKVDRYFSSVSLFEEQMNPQEEQQNKQNQPNQQQSQQQAPAPAQQQAPPQQQQQSQQQAPAPAQQQAPPQQQQQSQQQAPAPAPAQQQAPSQKAVEQVMATANKGVSLPGVNIPAGSQIQITPGDLSGNVNVQMGDKTFKVRDADVKQLIKTGDLSVASVAERFLYKVGRCGMFS